MKFKLLLLVTIFHFIVGKGQVLTRIDDSASNNDSLTIHVQRLMQMAQIHESKLLVFDTNDFITSAEALVNLFFRLITLIFYEY